MSSAPTPGQLVGRALKRLRDDRGWSQEDTARHLSARGLLWARTQVGDMEIGRRQDLSLSELILIAEAFGVRVADLLGTATGPVHLANTERPASVVRDMLTGSLPMDLGLGGPVDIPGAPRDILGPGPYWVRHLGRTSQTFGDGEVQVARRLGVDVATVQEVSFDLWEGRTFDAQLDRELNKRRTLHALRRRKGGAIAVGPEPDPADITEELVDLLRDRIESQEQPPHASDLTPHDDLIGPDTPVNG